MGTWKLLFVSTVYISIMTILLLYKFEIDRLKSKLYLLESDVEEIIRELKTKDESIKRLQADQAPENKNNGVVLSAVRKAEDIVSDTLEKGFAFSKDALKKVKTLDDQVIHLSEKMLVGTSIVSEKMLVGKSIVNEKVMEMDQRFQVSEKTKSAILSTRETIGSAGSAIKKNHYVSMGTGWVTGAFDRVVAKSTEYLVQKTKKNANEEKEGNDQVHGF